MKPTAFSRTFKPEQVGEKIATSFTKTFNKTEPPKADFSKLTPIEDLAGLQPFDNIVREDIERLAIKHPNIYGAIGSAVHTTRQIGDTLIDVLPVLKYYRPKDREEYLNMDRQHQIRAGLFEVLGVELWVGAEVVFGASKFAKVPIEDTQLWKSFSYETAIAEKMAARGHTAEVTELATSFLTGESTAVHSRIKSLAAGLDEATLLKDHIYKNFTSPLRNAGASQSKIGSIYDDYAAKVYGKEASAGMTIENASAEELKGFAGGWYASAAPTAEQAAFIYKGTTHELGAGLKYPFTSFYPVRYIFGDGEKTWGTYSKVYEPLIKATAIKNKYLSKKVHDFWKILEQKNLGTFTKGKFVPSTALTKKSTQDAFKIINDFDDIMGIAIKGGPKEIMAARQQIKGFMNKMAVDFPVTRALVDSHYSYMDKLYAERLLWKSHDLVAKAGLSRNGLAKVSLWSDRWTPKIKQAFDTRNGWSADQKVATVKNALDELKLGISGEVKGSSLNKELTYGSDSMFEYLENYSTRLVRREGALNDEFFQRLKTKGQPWYAKERSKMEAMSRPDDLESMIYIRTNSQAREMFYNDTLQNIARYSEALPDTYKEYISHYVARLHGIPSPLDYKLAESLGKIVPGLDARRIYNATKVINDFTYMGVLGFKPFSAMRNLFQVPIMVPADLGLGLQSGWKFMAKGYASLNDDATRVLLDKYGVVTDYGPELMRRSHVFGLPKNVAGFNLPRLDTIRDATMFMFSKADQTNRYVSGGAAIAQWEAGMLKGAGKVSKSMRFTGSNARTPWVRDKIRDLISRGNIDLAKETFVKDVVADTQYLYGNLDAPIVTQTMGSIGRQAAVFQSWWMNYGTALEKWMRTGKGPGGSVERMLTWTMSNFMVGTMMVPIWGKGVAVRSTLMGPFAGVQRGLTDPIGAAGMVPAWGPVAKGIGVAGAVGNLLLGGETEAVSKKASAMAKSVMNFAPGGVFSQQLLRASGKPEGITFDTIIGARR